MSLERLEGPKVPAYPDLRYPQTLVDRYGAKAGILLHVAQHLPDIPQARMIVSELGESDLEFTIRIKEANFEGSLLIRSSAVAELVGYEGVFPSFERQGAIDIEGEIMRVRTSPVWLRKQGEEIGAEVPDEINVIVAEKAKSSYVGTYLKHPNQQDAYLIGITETQSLKPFGQGGRFMGAQRFAYIHTQSKGLEFLRAYTSYFDVKYRPIHLEEQLATVTSWHDRIAALPEMDPSWSYQIEFGINPPCLFQVRPFKPFEKANFTLEENNHYGTPPIVIGVTPPEGIVARVTILKEARFFYEDEPVVIIDEMRNARYLKKLPNHVANIFEDSSGFLQHADIAAMRHAGVTVLASSIFYIPGGSKLIIQDYTASI